MRRELGDTRLVTAAAVIGTLVAVYAGCSGSDDVHTSGSGGSGTTSQTTTTSPGSGPGSSSYSTGLGDTTTTQTGPGGTGGSGGMGGFGGATGGSGGAGGFDSTGGFGGSNPWPVCDMQPSGVTSHTIPEVWSQLDTSTPTEVWVPGVYVTAISNGGCAAGSACQFFVQDALTYADFPSGAHHGIKIFVSTASSTYFAPLNIAVGDQIDVYGWAWRYDVDGQDELLIQVALSLPGCAYVQSKNNLLVPIPNVTLDQLTADAYEHSVGPLLISVADVRGTPALPAETFGLYTIPFDPDAGIDTVTSLSPYFMPGAVFTNDLTTGVLTQFTTVNGVFGLFVPPMQTPPISKYEEIYPRSVADYTPHTPVP